MLLLHTNVCLFYANGGSEEDVDNIIQIARSKRRYYTRVMCDTVEIQKSSKTNCTRRQYNRPRCTEQNVGQLERRRRGNCTQLKCACCGGQEEK